LTVNTGSDNPFSSPLSTFNDLHIFFNNVISVRNIERRLRLQAFVANNNYKIICLNETKLDQSILDSTILPEFVIYRTDRNSKGGGALTAVHKSLKSRRREELESKLKSLDSVIIQIYGQSRSVLIANYYRPPRLTSWARTFKKDLRRLTKSDTPVILFGDLNVNLLTESSPRTTLLDSFAECDLHQSVSFCTRHERTLLDVCAVSSVLSVCVKEAEKVFPKGDHTGLELTISLRSEKLICLQKTIFDFEKADYTSIANCIADTDWNQIVDGFDIDVAYDLWSKKMESIISTHIPSKSVMSGKPDFKFKDNDLKHLCVKRKALSKQIQKSYLDTTKLKILKKALSESIQIRLSELVSQDVMNFIQLNFSFKDIQRKLRYLKKPKPTHVLKTEDGRLLKDDKHIASAFNDHFVSTFTVNDGVLALPECAGIQFSELQINSEVLCSVLDSFDCTKAEGLSPLPNQVIAKLRRSLASPFSALLNLISRCAKLPLKLKSSVVTPIQKAGKNAALVNSYRAISVGPNTGKLCEEILVRNLSFVCEVNGIRDERQHGFSKDLSCETQLIQLIDYVNLCFDDKKTKMVIAVFFDFKDAFNKVPFNILIGNFKRIGISGNLLQLFENYFQGRTQRVRVGSEYSDLANVTSGVPQGGVLSPKGFAISMQTIPTCTSEQFLFADDTCYVKKVTSEADVLDLQSDIDLLAAWAQQSGFVLHPAKSESVIIKTSSASVNINCRLTIQDHEIANVVTHRHLGLILDNKLNFHVQVDTLVRKSFGSWFGFKNSFPKLTWKTYLQGYISYTRSILEFANLAYFPQSTDWIRVERVQKRILKFIYYVKHRRPANSYQECLSDLDMITIDGRRQLKALRLIQRIRKQARLNLISVPHNWTLKLTFENHQRTGLRAHARIGRILLNDKNFFFYSAYLFNSLPICIRESIDSDHFQSLCTTHIGSGLRP
jgi:exonuclease III